MTKRLLSDYIKAYQNTLTPADCQALIARFETSTAQHDVRVETGPGAYSFVQLDVTTHWPDEAARLQAIFIQCYTQYQVALDVRSFWPTKVRFENLRIKRYLPNGRDGFAPHVDVMDHPTARRFVTAILYLNQPEGGETVFPDLGLGMPPEPGKMIVFPPLWTFAHAGMPPRGGPKYILHSYMWYPD